MDWNLRTCARRGHVTYAPDEDPLADRLRASTPLGTAWRCLRCGDYVLGEPHGAGPAADAPVVLRGPVLRDAVILRLLAAERLGRGILIAATAYGVWRFGIAQGSLRRLFDQDLPALRPVANQFGVDLDSSSLVKLLRNALRARPSTLRYLAIGLAGYAGLNLVEGIGLWLLKRWGEYFAVVATSVFIPFEIHELINQITWLRVTAFVINVAAVAYLLWTKRLFGIRGGRAGYDAERHQESLLEVEASAAQAVTR